MSQKKLIIRLTICFIICFSFLLLNNNNRINISNNDILTTKEAEAATVFSNIEVTARKDTSATIQYNTDIVATGQIEYGLTTSYGNLTTEEGLSYWQSIELTGLTEGTTYHYRIIAKDMNDNETISSDYIFTTRTQAELEALVRAARTNGDLPKIYYVKTNGDDTKDGLSVENAWRSPSYAVQQAEAGDTIYLMDGTWWDEKIVFAHSGTEDNPITMTAYSGTPTLHSNTALANIDIAIKVLEKSYINISGLTLKHYWYHLYIRDSDHVRISDCTIYPDGGKGCGFTYCTDCSAVDCTAIGDGHNSFQAAYSSYITFKNCEVYNNSDHGSFDLSHDCHHIDILDCYAHDSLSGVYMHQHTLMHHLTISNNRFINMSADGIKTEHSVQDSYFFNNTFINCFHHPILFEEGLLNITFKDNYMRGDADFDMISASGSGSDYLFDQNDVHSDYGDREYRIGYGRGTIRNAIGTTFKVFARSTDDVTVEFTDGRIFSVDGSGEYTSHTLSEGVKTIEVLGGGLDVISPYTSSHSPSKSSTNISKNTNITLHIKDDGDGVDQSSIQMKVEGQIVLPIITGTSSDYTLTYNPPADFDYNQVVNVIIDAQDLASTPNAMNTESYSFTIAPEPAANELIAHWNFNETSGTNVSDSSGNNNAGIISDPSTMWTSEGKLNSALQFDGNDYVEVSDSISLDSINNQITLMAWIKTNFFDDYQNIIEKWDFDGVSQRSFELKIKTDRTVQLGLTPDGISSTWLTSNGTIDANQWTHIAATSDGTTMKIYINGQQDSNTATSPAGIYQSTADLHIGRWWGGVSWIWPFIGIIDELKIYNYALSQSEIQSDYQAGLNSDLTPPTGSILINSGDSKTNSQIVNLTISATDDSGLSEMKISETNNIDSASAEPYSTIKSFVLSIGDGLKTIYIWFKDTVGNWNTSPYSDSIELDSTGPIISNIQETNITTNSAIITFQTNENSTSQIEYGLTSSYGSSTTKDETLETLHSVNLTELSSDTTYHYRIVSEDNLTNSSNSIDKTFKTNQSSTPDTTPPANISNLSSSNVTQTSADLSWTSPGDDNNIGTASNYDIRYSTSNITESNWNQATQISGEPIPQSAGTEQSIYIAVGLSPNTKYYFAIKTSDEVPNTSDISNVVSFTTLASGGGSPGGGGTISDTTPPSKPSNFSATGADKQITLSWNNPTESDFVRVKLLRKENSSPTSHNDSSAVVIYEGTNQEYTDIELDNSKTYYYAIFAYDKKPNYSEILTISAKPIEGKTSIPNGNGKQTYPEGTLIKIPESFKIYVIINQKKKWIPTPEVFETLGYKWTSITEINKTELNNIQNYEDNLIRAINNYKVYLVVSGIKRHIPNPDIFLNYGFEWDDVKDVNQETINQYSQNLLIKESKQQKVYYLCPERKIRRWLRSPEIFNSYDNKWEDIQVISKYEMEYYMESNLIKLIGDNKVYLIENNTKRWIKSAEEFNRLGLDWEMVMEVDRVEYLVFSINFTN